MKHPTVVEAAVQTILLVDGYNIVGAWPRLVRLRDRDGLEAARSVLIEEMASFAHFRGWRTTLVFDAQMVASPLVRSAETEMLEVCFTEHEQTADSFIEQYSYTLLREHPGRRVLVATSDRAQQLVVLGQGADWFSADRLRQEVEHARRQMRDNLRRQRSKPGSKLGDLLDPQVREHFSRWRQGS